MAMYGHSVCHSMFVCLLLLKFSQCKFNVRNFVRTKLRSYADLDDLDLRSYECRLVIRALAVVATCA